MVGGGDVVEIEVECGGLEFEKEVEIEVVVAGAGVVFAGEALDGGDVIPKSKHLEVGDVIPTEVQSSRVSVVILSAAKDLCIQFPR